MSSDINSWVLVFAVWGFLILFLSLLISDEGSVLEFFFLALSAVCFMVIGWMYPTKWTAGGLFLFGPIIGVSGERLLVRRKERDRDDDAEA